MAAASSALIRFTMKTAGMVWLPFAIQTAFFVLAPSTLERHPFVVLALGIGTGLLANTPFAPSSSVLLRRFVYVVVMLYALVAWSLFVLAPFFPDQANLVFRHIDL